MTASTTTLSKKYLEKKGYTVERVEYWNSFTHHRVDFLGVADLIALDGTRLLLVQVTSRNSMSTRRNKSLKSEKLKLWLSAGGEILFHGWDKPAHRYRLKITDIYGKEIKS